MNDLKGYPRGGLAEGGTPCLPAQETCIHIGSHAQKFFKLFHTRVPPELRSGFAENSLTWWPIHYMVGPKAPGSAGLRRFNLLY